MGSAEQATSEDNKACLDFRDDYIECLHHRKEVRLYSKHAVIVDRFC